MSTIHLSVTGFLHQGKKNLDLTECGIEETARSYRSRVIFLFLVFVYFYSFFLSEFEFNFPHPVSCPYLATSRRRFSIDAHFNFFIVWLPSIGDGGHCNFISAEEKARELTFGSISVSWPTTRRGQKSEELEMDI